MNTNINANYQGFNVNYQGMNENYQGMNLNYQGNNANFVGNYPNMNQPQYYYPQNPQGYRPPGNY